MNILFFDTETTGKCKNWRGRVTDVNNWPQVVQFAYMLCNEGGIVFRAGNFLMKPTIPIEKGAEKVHGYSDEMVKGCIGFEKMKAKFFNLFKSADLAVCHNVNFDKQVVQCELYRYGMDYTLLNRLEWFCTMTETTELLKLPGPYGYKWPKLEELYPFLHGGKAMPKGAHDAFVDVTATKDCFFELMRQYPEFRERLTFDLELT